jgi:DNA mismatch repair protein MutS
MAGDQKMCIITGPNMGGKSTFMRAVGICTILAQMGSFVPAKSAHLSVMDKLLVRIGAGDDMSLGISTFMAEMLSVGNILKNATAQSLVLVDELGESLMQCGCSF